MARPTARSPLQRGHRDHVAEGPTWCSESHRLCLFSRCCLHRLLCPSNTECSLLAQMLLTRLSAQRCALRSCSFQGNCSTTSFSPSPRNTMSLPSPYASRRVRMFNTHVRALPVAVLLKKLLSKIAHCKFMTRIRIPCIPSHVYWWH